MVDRGATVRNVLSLCAVLFSLGLIALIAALTISESAKVSAVLASIGASPRMRRSQAAATTGAVAAIASMAAAPVGIVIAAVANNGTPLRPPFVLLGAMLLGLVFVAGFAGALFTRNAPSVFQQRAFLVSQSYPWLTRVDRAEQAIQLVGPSRRQ